MYLLEGEEWIEGIGRRCGLLYYSPWALLDGLFDGTYHQLPTGPKWIQLTSSPFAASISLY